MLECYMRKLVDYFRDCMEDLWHSLLSQVSSALNISGPVWNWKKKPKQNNIYCSIRKTMKRMGGCYSECYRLILSYWLVSPTSLVYMYIYKCIFFTFSAVNSYFRLGLAGCFPIFIYLFIFFFLPHRVRYPDTIVRQRSTDLRQNQQRCNHPPPNSNSPHNSRSWNQHYVNYLKLCLWSILLI